MLEFLSNRKSLTISLLALILLYGVFCYKKIVKEEFPEIHIPVINTMVYMRSISPDDAEKLIARPIERRLRTIPGVKKVTSKNVFGMSVISTEFRFGVDIDKMLQKIKDSVDEVKEDLPDDIDKIIIKDIDISQMPILKIVINGYHQYDEMVHFAKDLKNYLKDSIREISDIKLKGNTSEQIEVIVDNTKMVSYGIDLKEIQNAIISNNQAQPSSSIKVGDNKFQFKIKSLIKNAENISEIIVKKNHDQLVKIGDIATVVKKLPEPAILQYFNGNSAIILDISKVANTDTVVVSSKIKKAISSYSNPKKISIELINDSSDRVSESSEELTNSIIFATLLVILIIAYGIGNVQSLIISISIPLSFLMSIAVVYFLGYTLNIVVFFGFIMAIGMIVDGSIIVVEYADKLISSGVSVKDAYKKASLRMSVPVLSAVVGIIVVYAPLFFWPGLVGEFMKFIPITIVVTLFSSILSALIFIPVIGEIFDKRKNEIKFSNEKQGKFINWYIAILEKILQKPKQIIYSIISLLILSFVLLFLFGNGVEFFPQSEPKHLLLDIRGSQDMIISKKTEVAKIVSSKIEQNKNIKNCYLSIGESVNSGDGVEIGENSIISGQIEMKYWRYRERSEEIIPQILENIGKLPYGATVELNREKTGPSKQKNDIFIEVSGLNSGKINEVIKKIKSYLQQNKNLNSISSSVDNYNIELLFDINQKATSKDGISVLDISSRLATFGDGYRVGKYTPDDDDERISIVIKQDQQKSDLYQVDNQLINISDNNASLSKFYKYDFSKKISTINKKNGRILETISGNVNSGMIVSKELSRIMSHIKSQNYEKDGIIVSFGSDDEDQKETGSFLISAFGLAILIKLIILIAQYNSIYFTFVTISAVALSLTGVFLALVLTAQPFGIVMCGLGVISLMGIVVSNNIIFIDTYQKMIAEGGDKLRSIVETARQRIRPILLTTITTIIGLIPMVLNINIDLLGIDIIFNAPSGEIWQQLSLTIASGLIASTILSLVFTPAMLAMRAKKSQR